MSIFRKKQKDIPTIDTDRYEPVLRCSICTGEQVLCVRDRSSGATHELMLITSGAQLEEICEANGIEAAGLRKVY